MSVPILKGDIAGKSHNDLYAQAHNIVEQFYGNGYEEFIEVSLTKAHAVVDYLDDSTLSVESFVMGETTFYATFEARLLYNS